MELFRFHGIHIVKGTPETVQVFMGQPCNQVQVLVHVPAPVNSGGNLLYLLQVGFAPYGLQCPYIGGLDPDFQLHQPGTHLCKKVHLLFVQQVGCYLKMKVGDTVVMFLYELPDGHGMALPAVKGPVHKFHLRDPGIQEIT